MSQAPSFTIIQGKELRKWCALYQGSPVTAWLSHRIEHAANEEFRLYQLDEGVVFGEMVGDHLNLHGMFEDPAKVLKQFAAEKVTCWLQQDIGDLAGWQRKQLTLFKADALPDVAFQAQAPAPGWEQEFLRLHPDFTDTYRSGLHLSEKGGQVHTRYHNNELVYVQIWQIEHSLYIGHYVWSQLKGVDLMREFFGVQSNGFKRVSWVSLDNAASVALHTAAGYQASAMTITGYIRD